MRIKQLCRLLPFKQRRANFEWSSVNALSSLVVVCFQMVTSIGENMRATSICIFFTPTVYGLLVDTVSSPLDVLTIYVLCDI